jgi:hypothetical protein
VSYRSKIKAQILLLAQNPAASELVLIAIEGGPVSDLESQTLAKLKQEAGHAERPGSEGPGRRGADRGHALRELCQALRWQVASLHGGYAVAPRPPGGCRWRGCVVCCALNDYLIESLGCCLRLAGDTWQARASRGSGRATRLRATGAAPRAPFALPNGRPGSPAPPPPPQAPQEVQQCSAAAAPARPLRMIPNEQRGNS